MSEEEKKAIEILESVRISLINFNEVTEEIVKVISSIKTIINLVENQQKEIERLRDIEADYIRRMKASNKLLLKQGYISKDKIKAKIDELENEIEQLQIEKNVTFDSGIYRLTIQKEVLQSLLEKE